MGDIFGRGLAYGLGTDRADNWRDRARCLNVDPETFSPLPNDWITTAAALRVCQVCPVKAECLADAVDKGDVHTIRGGTTPQQRAADRLTQAADEPAEPTPAFAAANTVRALNRGGKCTNGLHEMTEPNTYVSSEGYTCCKTCRQDNQRAYRRRRAERDRAAREQMAAAGGAR